VGHRDREAALRGALRTSILIGVGAGCILPLIVVA
jgi:hypothetical protein